MIIGKMLFNVSLRLVISFLVANVTVISSYAAQVPNSMVNSESRRTQSRSVLLNNYGNWTFGHTGESAFALEQRLVRLSKRDRIVIPETAEWPNDVDGWSKLKPKSLRTLNPNTKVYRYVSLMGKSVNDSDWCEPFAKVSRMNCPLTKSSIDENDWWLRDGEGNIVKEPDGKIWYLDVGKPGFKEAWLTNTLKRNAGKEFDGFVLDLLHPDITTSWFGVPGGWFSKHLMPKSYPTSDDWYRKAWQPFFEYVVDGLRKAGYEVIGNCAGEHDQLNSRIMWQRSKLDGVIYEQGVVDWNGSWLPGTELSRRMAAFAADTLKEVWIANGALTKTIPEFDQKRTVALAMYYITLPEGSTRHSLNVQYSNMSDWWDTNWDLNIGKPLGQPIKRSGKFFWTRVFTEGIVFLNYEEKETLRFRLAGEYQDSSGKLYTGEIELPPRTALILAKWMLVTSTSARNNLK
jgi:hypothetical protein